MGNKVIEQWLASQGKSITDFTAIDRLCYIGKRGMGALEYAPASSEISDINESINVSEMVNGDCHQHMILRIPMTLQTNG